MFICILKKDGAFYNQKNIFHASERIDIMQQLPFITLYGYKIRHPRFGNNGFAR
jgi:hypothetical protein